MSVKKFLFRFTSGGVILIFLTLIGFCLVFWTHPGWIVKIAKRFLPEEIKSSLDFESIDGNPSIGYTINELSYDHSLFKFLARSLYIDISWPDLLAHGIYIEKLDLHEPRVFIKESKDSPKAPPQRSDKKNSWSFSIEDGSINNGTIKKWGDNTPEILNQLYSQFSYKDNRVDLKNLKTIVQTTTITAKGQIEHDPLTVDLSLTSEGLISGNYLIKGSTHTWTLDAQAHKNFPQGLLEVDLKANGSGIEPKTLSAQANGNINFKKEPLLQFKSIIKNQSAQWNIIMASNVAHGNAQGQINLTSLNLDAAFEVSLLPKHFKPWTDSVQSSATAKAHLSGVWPDIEFDLKGQMNDTLISTVPIKLISFNIHGRQESHRFWVKANNDIVGTELKGTGSFKENNWAGEFSALRIEWIEFGDIWESKNPFTLSARPPYFQLENLTLSDGYSSINLKAKIRDNVMDYLQFDIDQFQLEKLNERQLIEFPLNGHAKSVVNLSGPFQNPQGNIKISVQDLQLKNRLIGNLEANAQLTASHIKIQEMNFDTPQGKVSVTALLPIPKKKKADLDFEVHLNASQYDYSSLLKSFYDAEIKGANLNADMTIIRKGNEISTEGDLKLNADQFRPVKQGPELTELQLHLVGNGQELSVQKGEALSGKKGRVKLSGSLKRKNPDIQLISKELVIKWPIGIQGTLDTDIKYSGSWEEPKLFGLITITQADYTPVKQKEKKGDTSDNLPSPLSMDLDIKFDRNVWFKQKQTSIELKGDLNIKKAPFEDLRIIGKIETIRGDYVTYGRVFNINEGSINFVGNIPVNPFLSLKATYIDKVSKIRVYLHVTGSLENPQLTLSSEPPLDEADIVSVLATGKPLYELGKNDQGAQSSQVAQNLVAGYLSEEIRQELQNFIGLDVFRVNIGNDETTDVVTGKNITENLFVSYGQTLGPSGEQRINAEYNLSRHWSLEGYTTSLGRYVIDLLFKFGFK